MDPVKSTERCLHCAQPAMKLKCSRCKSPYCSVACQTLDWKRGHKAICARLVKEAAARGDEAPTPPPSPKPKAAPPVVDGPARGRDDVARAKAAAAAATAPPPPVPDEDDGPFGRPFGTRCPICLDDWNVNVPPTATMCCCKAVCSPCADKLKSTCEPCPLCRTPFPSGKESLAMIRRNVELNNSVAITQLGSMYEFGRGVVGKSHKKAARLYKRAAALGHAQAMVLLGCLYYEGHGVKVDKKRGIEYVRMAADQGHASAQNNLAVYFRDGNGVDQDYVEAARLLKLAADQGHTEAEVSLGWMYMHGQVQGRLDLGRARNLAEASRLLFSAESKGDRRAKGNLLLLMAIMEEEISHARGESSP